MVMHEIHNSIYGGHQILSENNYKDLLEKIIQSNDNIRLAAICGNFGTITEKAQSGNNSPS